MVRTVARGPSPWAGDPELDRNHQLIQTADEIAVAPGGYFGFQRQAGIALEKHLQHGFCLQPRQLRTQTQVNAMAEAYVLHVFSQNIEAIRVVVGVSNESLGARIWDQWSVSISSVDPKERLFLSR